MLSLDLRWSFVSQLSDSRQLGQVGGTALVRITQSAVATLTIDAGVYNDKTITISGTVPTPGVSEEGYAPMVLSDVVVVVGDTSVGASGNASSLLLVDIGP